MAAKCWADSMRMYVPHSTDDSFGDWIRACWTDPETGRTLSATQTNIIGTALCLVPVDEALRVRWKVDEDTDCPIDPAWGDKEGRYTYWHGSQVVLLPSIRKYGLLPSIGTKSEDYVPMLYCCINRSTPFSQYASNSEESIIMVGHPFFRNCRRYPRRFKMLIGIEPLGNWPWHSTKVIKRKTVMQNQYPFFLSLIHI